MHDYIVSSAQTIREKSKFFNENIEIDYTFLKEWRNVRTLMTDELFELMLKEEGYTLEEFANSLQESNEFADNPEWYDKFLFIIQNYDYNNINYEAGISVLTLPFSKYTLDNLKSKISNLDNFRVDEEIFDKIILYQNDELFNLIGKIMALNIKRKIIFLIEMACLKSFWKISSILKSRLFSFLKNTLLLLDY